MPIAFWGGLFILLMGGTIWGLSRLPKKHKKGETFPMDGGGFGSP
jgi:hypothetical protein